MLNRTNYLCGWRTCWFAFVSVSMNHPRRREAGLVPLSPLLIMPSPFLVPFFFFNLTGAWMKTTYGSSFSSPFCSPPRLSLHFCCMCRWVCDVRDFSNSGVGGGEANGDQPAHVERHGCSLMWLQLRSPGPNEVPWRLGCSSSHRLRTSSPHTATAQDH